MITIQKSTTGFFSITDSAGNRSSYPVGNYDFIPSGDGSSFSLVDNNKRRILISNLSYQLVNNGDTSSAFASLSDLQAYVEANFFRKAGSGPGTLTWGSITGTLSAQTDLQAALNATQPLLVSGTNIKTINSQSLLGSGNLIVGGSGTSTPTANTNSQWDGNVNFSGNNFISGYTTIATAAGTTTLTVTSTRKQFFTGTTTQTVVLPVTSTLALGFEFEIANNSTGVVTVQSSGGNTITTLSTGTALKFTCILTSGTTAASWSVSNQVNFATGTFTGDGSSGNPYTLVVPSSNPGGSSSQIQYNSSGAFAGSSNFTIDPSTFQLYIKGPNATTQIINAATNSNLNFQSNGVTYGYVGSGQSSNLTGATDFVVKGTGNVGIEGSHVNIYGLANMPGTTNFGYASGSLAQLAVGGSGASAYTNLAFLFNNSTNRTIMGNSDNVLTSPNNTGDWVIATTKNMEFATGASNPSQSNVSGQIFQTTGNWLFQRGGTFVDNGSTVQTQSFSMAINSTAKTTAYTATTTDHTIVGDATSAGFTITVPTAVGCQGREYTIKKIDSSANAVTIGTTSSQTIDGATTYALSTQWQFVTIRSNGSNWYITGK